MSDFKQNWSEVADRLEALGLKLKLHGEQSGGQQHDRSRKCANARASGAISHEEAAKGIGRRGMDPGEGARSS